jgi:hypothetical protein
MGVQGPARPVSDEQRAQQEQQELQRVRQELNRVQYELQRVQHELQRTQQELQLTQRRLQRAQHEELRRPQRLLNQQRDLQQSQQGQQRDFTSARQLLVRGEDLAAGYGLYTFLLFESRPTLDAEPKYVAALVAYLQRLEDVAEVERYFRRSSLNVTYVPVVTKIIPSTDEQGARLILRNYDYARALALLSEFRSRSTQDRGPYLLSYHLPKTDCLFQDMSTVPPHVIRLWTDFYLRQVERSGVDEPMPVLDLPYLTLRTRTTLAQLAEIVDQLPAGALDKLISILRIK